ncbi:RNA polymerase sigma-B factor [Glycomyces sambucus]|uniref:RNA polymerase sigma-B factor n=1 Tax=Glycomyces sambucus TaxID=380244 RepID=A0A1G9CDS4_9ACTN|nr:sigma factor [Glycomyces sambucus]SDK49799.1 RNA polymerase sigma-B factor [Glycomyces sambucus]
MLVQHLPVPSTPTRADEFTPLLAQLQGLADGDPRAGLVREEVVIAAVPLLHHIAYRFTGRGLPQDQLLEIAAAALNAAVDRFTQARSGDFLAYAVPRIADELRRRCHTES